MRAEAMQAREASQGTELSLVRRAVGLSAETRSAEARSGKALSAGALLGETVLSDEAVLPVLPALRGLLPGLRRGSVVAAGPWSLLCLALAAGASAAGAWCAVVGLPQLGVAAAAGVGLDPDRMLLIADPGAGWPQVVASLLDGCELVLLRPPDRPAAQVRRRIEATVRRFGGVLVVAGEWDGAQARLSIAQQEWTGIGTGHGRLRARRVQVVTDGRGEAARPRTQWLWLPGPDGSVTAADQASAARDPFRTAPAQASAARDPFWTTADQTKAARDPFWPEIRSTG